MLKPCIWRRDASANVPSVVQKGPHFCGFSSETTHHVDQCPTPPGMHFFPGVKGVGWGRDAARRLGPGTHTHSPTPIFPTCSWAPLSAWSRWDGVAGGRMLCHQPTFSICFKAAHREDSNAEKQEQCLTNPIGAQTGFTFFFSRVNTNIIAFSSLQVLTGSCHSSYSLWAHTSLEGKEGTRAPAGSICQARVSPGRTTYLFPFSFRKIFNYYPIRVKF